MNSTDMNATRGGLVTRATRFVLTALVTVVMFAMMMLVTADVAGRALFNAPVRGSFEVLTFLLAILVFASLPLVTWDEKHITVSLFDRWIPTPARRALDVALSVLSTLVVAVITYRMWIQGQLMAEGQHITGLLEWPIAPVAFVMSALSGLTTLILIVLTWHKITGHAPAAADRGRYPGETE
jgi:TRAP-type C4-dicarboxylate transport system permease small subunit